MYMFNPLSYGRQGLVLLGEWANPCVRSYTGNLCVSVFVEWKVLGMSLSENSYPPLFFSEEEGGVRLSPWWATNLMSLHSFIRCCKR